MKSQSPNYYFKVLFLLLLSLSMGFTTIYSVPLRKQMITQTCYTNLQNPALSSVEIFSVNNLMQQGSLTSFLAFSFGGWVKVQSNALGNQSLFAMCNDKTASMNNNQSILGVWLNSNAKQFIISSNVFGSSQAINLAGVTYLNQWIPIMVTVNTSTNLAIMRAALTQNNFSSAQIPITTASLFTTYPNAWMNLDTAYSSASFYNACAMQTQMYFYHSPDEDYQPDIIQQAMFDGKKYPYLFFDFKEWKSSRLSSFEPLELFPNYSYQGQLTAQNGDSSTTIDYSDASLQQLQTTDQFDTYILSTGNYITLPDLANTSSFAISFILNFNLIGVTNVIILQTTDGLNTIKLVRNQATQQISIEFYLFSGASDTIININQSGLRHTIYFECRLSGNSITLINYYIDSQFIKQILYNNFYSGSKQWIMGSPTNLGLQNSFSFQNLMIFRDSTVDLTANLPTETQAPTCLLQATINSGFYASLEQFCLVCANSGTSGQVSNLEGVCLVPPNNDIANYQLGIGNFISGDYIKSLIFQNSQGKAITDTLNIVSEYNFLVIGYFKLTQTINKPIPMIIFWEPNSYYISCMISVLSETTLLLRYIPDQATQYFEEIVYLDQPISNRWIVLGISFQNSYKILQFIYSKVEQTGLFYQFVSPGISSTDSTWQACIACLIPGGLYDQFTGVISSLKHISGIDNINIINQNLIDEQYFSIMSVFNNPSIVFPITNQSTSSSQMNIYQFNDYVLSINPNLFPKCDPTFFSFYQGACVFNTECNLQPSTMDPAYGFENNLYSDTTFLTCMPCSSNCLTCTTSPWTCATCFSGYGLSGTACVKCGSGTYSDPTTKTCVASCPSGYSADLFSNSCSNSFNYVSNTYSFLNLRLFDSGNIFQIIDSNNLNIRQSSYVTCSLFPNNYHSTLYSFLGGVAFTSAITIQQSWSNLPQNYAKRITFDVLFSDTTSTQNDITVTLNFRQMSLETGSTVNFNINNMPCINYNQDVTIQNRQFYKLSYYLQDNLSTATLTIQAASNGWAIRNINIQILRCHPTCDSCQNSGSSEDCTSIASSVAASKCSAIDAKTNRCGCPTGQYVAFQNCYSSPCFTCTNCPNPLGNSNYYKSCEDLTGRVTNCGTGQHVTSSYTCVPGSCGTTQATQGFAVISASSLYCQKQFDQVQYSFKSSSMVSSIDYWGITQQNPNAYNPFKCNGQNYPYPYTNGVLMAINLNLPFTQNSYVKMNLLFNLLDTDTSSNNSFKVVDGNTNQQLYSTVYSSNFSGFTGTCNDNQAGTTYNFNYFQAIQVSYPKSDYSLNVQFVAQGPSTSSGSTFNEVTFNYVRCLPLCTKCTLDNTKPEGQYCTQCQTNAVLYTSGSTQKCKCSPTFFEYSDYTNSIDTCRPCSKGCSVCSTPSMHGQCTACIPGYSLVSDYCVYNCLSNQYYDGTTCQYCDSSCASCNGPSSTNCTSCSSTQYLSGNTCYFLQDGSQTQSCQSATNSLCSGSRINHNFCIQNGWVVLNSNTCVSCSQYISGACGGTNSILCNTNNFVYQGSLGICSSCQVAQSNNSCGVSGQNCATNGWVFSQGPNCIYCGSSSPNALCGTCHPTCSQCSANNSPTSCTKCSGNLYLFNNQCLPACPNGTKINSSTNNCDVCPDDKNLGTCFYGFKTCQNLNQAYPNQQTSCQSCYSSRTLTSQGQCVCKNTSDTRLNFYECSYNNQAVLQSLLSYQTPLLTIDFGSAIITSNTVAFSVSSYTTQFCTYLFDPTFLTLLGAQSTCSLQGSQILVNLDPTSNIEQYSQVVFLTNVLSFQGNSQQITTYLNTVIYQLINPLPGQITYTYNTVENTCNKMKIIHQQVLNDGQRGFQSLTWSVSSIVPPDSALQNTLQTNYLTPLSTSLGLDLIIDRMVVPAGVIVNIQLSFVMKITSTGTINFSFSFKEDYYLTLNFLSSLVNPFYLPLTGVISIFYQVTLCNNYGDPQVVEQPVNFSVTSTQDPSLSYSETNSNNSEYLLTIPSYFVTTANQMITLSVKQLKQSSESVKFFLFLFQAILSLTNTPTVTLTQTYSFYLSETTLQVQIQGQSGQANYLSPVTLNSYLRDLDNPSTVAANQNINVEWVCINPLNYQTCLQQNGSQLTFPSNVNSIIIPASTFPPYTVVQIQLTGSQTSTNRKTIDQKIIFFAEVDLPSLLVNLKMTDVNQITVNMNEVITASLLYNDQYNTPIDLLSFSGTIVYESNVVGIMKFDYTTVSFQIWNFYSGFNLNQQQLSIRFSVFNPRFFMPSIAILPLILNFPPQLCSFQVTQIDQHPITLQVFYLLSMTNCLDINQPLQYQFFFYNSNTELQNEIINPQQATRKQLCDIQSNNQIKSYLPSGNIVLMAQSIDSKQAIYNITYPITVADIQYTETQLVAVLEFRLQLATTTPVVQAITDLSVCSEDLCARTAFLTSAPINQKKVLMVSALQQYSASLSPLSSAITIANKAVSSLLACGADLADSASQQQFFTNLNTLMNSKPPATVQNLQSYLTTLQQVVFDNFKVIDSLSGQSTTKDAAFYTSQLGFANQVSASMVQGVLPNQDEKFFLGSSVSLLGQVVTSKGLCQYFYCDPIQYGIVQGGITSGSSTPDPTIYNMKLNFFEQNPFSSDTSFQQYITNLTQALNGTGTVQNFQVIIPSLSNSITQQPVTINSHISIPFKASGPPTAQMACLSKQKTGWTTSGCKNEYNAAEQAYICTCASLNPTTVINDISALANNENIHTVFSSQGITNISNFNNFYEYYVFWALSGSTLALIILVIKAKALDAGSIRTAERRSSKIRPLQPDFNEDEKVINEMDEDIMNLSIEMNIKQNENGGLADHSKEPKKGSDENSNSNKEVIVNGQNHLDENKSDIETNLEGRRNNEESTKKSTILQNERQNKKDNTIQPPQETEANIAQDKKYQLNEVESLQVVSMQNDPLDQKSKQPTIVNLSRVPTRRNSVRKRVSKTSENPFELFRKKEPTLTPEQQKQQQTEVGNLKDQRESEPILNKEQSAETPPKIQLDTKLSNAEFAVKESIPLSQRRTSITPSVRRGKRKGSGSENTLLSLRKSKTILIPQRQASSYFTTSKLKQIILFHNFFGIFYLYHPDFSRSFRVCIFYTRLVHSLAVSIFFDQSYSYVQQAFISAINAVMIIAVIKLLEFIASIRLVGKVISSSLILGLLGFYYYLMLAIVSGQPPSSTNGCLINFGIVSVGDILVVSTLSAILQSWISTKVLKVSELEGFRKTIFEFLELNLIIENLLS